ncbi:Uma2 family endonuclease [Deinococcus cavernae]|uniref:Uma2 family endonuclease n=1 Tax=Deinococcus cavernae TaxID=2320857 RepID=UPI0018F4A9EE
MTDPAFKLISVEEYLRSERDHPVRHEYVDGFVYAQAGASRAHNVITSNIHVALHGPARKAGCQVFQSDMKVRVTPPAAITRTLWWRAAAGRTTTTPKRNRA